MPRPQSYLIPFPLISASLVLLLAIGFPCRGSSGAAMRNPPPHLILIDPQAAWNFGTAELTGHGQDFVEPAQLLLLGGNEDLITGTTVATTPTSVVARFDMTGRPVGEWSGVLVSGDGQRDTLAQAFRTSQSPWGSDRNLINDTDYSLLWGVSGRALVRDASQRLHLFWTDTQQGGTFKVFWKIRVGNTWSDAMILPEDVTRSLYPVCAASPTGPVAVAWEDARDEYAWEIYAKIWSNGSWGPDQRITNTFSNSWYPSLAADPAGRFHLVWREEHGAGLTHGEIAYSRWENGSWSSPVPLTSNDGFDSIDPTIACDASGRVYVAWLDTRFGGFLNDEILMRVWDGSQWGPESQLTDALGIRGTPSMVSRGEAVYLVWQDTRNDDGDIFFRRIDVGETEQPIVQGPGVSSQAMMDVTEDGDLHLCWVENRTGRPVVWYKTFEATEGIWSLDDRVGSLADTLEEAAAPNIAAGPDGALDIVWQEEIAGDQASDIFGISRHRIAAGIESTAPGRSLTVIASPNPFRSAIEFRIPGAAGGRATTVQVLDVAGRSIRTLLGPGPGPAREEIIWDGRDGAGREVPLGVYFCRVRLGEERSLTRIVHLR